MSMKSFIYIVCKFLVNRIRGLSRHNLKMQCPELKLEIICIEMIIEFLRVEEILKLGNKYSKTRISI